MVDLTKRNTELNTKLYYKIFDEMAEYREELLHKPLEEILMESSQYTVKRDILFALETFDLPDSECEALLAEENALHKIYLEFEDRETDYMDDIRYSIDFAASKKQKETRDD